MIYDVQLGSVDIPNQDFQTGAFLVKARIDNLNSIYFPLRGIFLGIDYYKSLRALNSYAAYQKLMGQAHAFGTLGRHTLFGGVHAATNLDTEIPLF